MALAVGLMATAQVKIGTNVENINPASILELESSTQGVNFPKLALTSTTVAAPLAGDAHVAGMTVYNTATAGDVTPGLYSNNGTAWVKLGGSSSSALSITVPTTDNYTVLDSDSVIYRNLTASGFITFPSTIPAGKVFYLANLSADKSWAILPTPINTGQNSVEGGLSQTVITLGGGQLLMVSGY